jgi:hypothetical protein
VEATPLERRPRLPALPTAAPGLPPAAAHYAAPHRRLGQLWVAAKAAQLADRHINQATAWQKQQQGHIVGCQRKERRLTALEQAARSLAPCVGL